MATNKRTGLGRGIGALIPTAPAENAAGERAVDVFFPTQDQLGSTEGLLEVPGARLAYLSPQAIVPNAVQPRHVFDPEDLAELVASIREVGVLQPIVVRPIPGKTDEFELIMGERRLRASKELGLESIPAIIKDTADENMLRDALLENLHRAQLNPLEEAQGVQRLHDRVVGLDHTATQITGVRLASGGTLGCAQVVNASGAWGGEVAAMAAVQEGPYILGGFAGSLADLSQGDGPGHAGMPSHGSPKSPGFVLGDWQVGAHP